jgi:hypothetical protein
MQGFAPPVPPKNAFRGKPMRGAISALLQSEADRNVIETRRAAPFFMRSRPKNFNQERLCNVVIF